MAKYFSSSVLSGKRKKPPRERLDDQRYRYLGLENAEPDLGDPLVGPSSEGANPVKSGDQYIVVAVEGFPGERFWIPNQGGLIPGSISVFDESNLVGTLSSITQLDFLGAGVKATTDIAKTTTVTLDGNFSFSESQRVTQVGNSDAFGVVKYATTNAGIVTLTGVVGNFNTSGELQQAGNNTGVTPTSLSIFNDPSIRAQIEITPEFFSENRQFIFNDNDEFNGALNLTYNQSNGYVGVGTTSATQMLDVRGNLRLSGTVYDSNNFGGDAGDLLVKSSDSEELEWASQGSIKPDADGIRGSVQYFNSVGQIGGAPNFVFNDISGVNNVGIGSTLPQVDLDVVGVASITGNLRVGTLSVSGISTYSGDLDINASVDISTNLEVNGTSTFNDPVSITTTTESTSFSTGSLKVTGGVGIGSSVFIGQSLNLLDEKKINIGDDKDLQIYHSVSGAGSSSYIDNLTGDIYIRNNVDDDDGGNIYLQAKSGEDGIIINDDGAVELYHNGIKKLQTISSGIQIFDTVTAETFNGTDGELTDITITGLADIFRADIEQLNITNGVGIATIKEIDATHTDTDTLNVGIAATIAKLTVDNVQIDGNNVTATTGNLLLTASGGTSFITIDKPTRITDTTDLFGAAAALIISGGVDIDKKLNVDGTVTFTKNTESTSPTTGALQITGGVGIAKNLNIAGITSITNTTVSTSSTTGALKVAGGVGIFGDLNIGATVGFGSTAVPSVNNQHDFGSISRKWKNIYANEFIGRLTGSSEKTDITADSTNTNRFIFLSDVSSGSATAFGDTDLIYNPSVNALGIATDRFDIAVSSTNTGKIAVGIVTAYELYGSLRGNADTATKLLNSRDFSIDGGEAAGDVFSSVVSFDGTANVVLDGSLRDSGVTAGTYGNKNAEGKGTAYARIEVNAQGVITSAEEVNIDGGEITVDTAKNVAISEQTDSTAKHYIHFGDIINTNLADKTTYDRVNVDSEELVYVPNTGVGIGSTAPTTKLDVGGESRTTTLTVEEISTFNGESTFNSNVDVDASVDIQNELIVGGATTLANNGGITTTGGDLYVGGSLFADVIDIEDAINTQSLVVTGIATINQLEIGTVGETLVGITSILDEDDMASDSATALATQQSIKKYVDDQDGGQFLKFSDGVSIPGGGGGFGQVNLATEIFEVKGTTNEITTTVIDVNNEGGSLANQIQIGLPDNVTISGNLTAGNDVNTDTVTFNSKIASNFLPSGSRDIGASGNEWTNVFAETVTANVTGNVTGNSDSATKLQTPRTFTMGDENDSYDAGVSDDIVSIGKTFDGTQNVGFALSLTNTGVTSALYGDNLSVAQFRVDARGRINSASNVAIDQDALTAGQAKKILVDEHDTDETCYLTFINQDPDSNYEDLLGDDQLTYNPGTNALGVAGAVTIGGLLDANGDVDLGASDSNTLSVNALVDTSLSPSHDASDTDDADGKDLGTSDKYWRKAYIKELIGDTVSATATSADTIKTVARDTNASHYITFVDSNNSTADFESLYTDAGISYNPNTNKLDITGATTVGGNLNVNGNTTLGDTDATTDTVTFNSKVDSDILPSHNATSKDDTDGKILGSSSDYWRKIYVKELIGTTVTANATSADEALKLTNARDFSISGDGTAPAVSFDGTQTDGVDLELTLNTVNNSEGLPGPFGSSTAIPKITVNEKGLVTAIETVGADFLGQVTDDANFINTKQITSNNKAGSNLAGDHYLTFVNSNNTSTLTDGRHIGAYEDLYTDAGITYVPGTDTLNLTRLNVSSTATFEGSVDIGTESDPSTVYIHSLLSTNLLPNGSSIDIGSATSKYDKMYANEFVGAVAGLADEASKLNPGVKITISGDVAGTPNTNFTGDTTAGDYDIGVALDEINDAAINLPAVNADNTITKIPRIAVDKKGRVTGVTEHDITLPSNVKLTAAGRNTALLFNDNDTVGYTTNFSIVHNTSGGIIGTIFDINTTSSINIPLIRYHGNNADARILRINGPAKDSIGGNYGFDIRYMGGRSGFANALSIFADNKTGPQIEAFNMLQNGNTGFGVVQTSSTATEHDIPATGGGVVTVGKLKAREIEVNGDIKVTNTTELDGLNFINLGDTPSAYAASQADANKYVKVNTSGNGLIFDTLDTNDIDGFNTAVNNLIEGNSNITSGQISNFDNAVNNLIEGNNNITSGQIGNFDNAVNDLIEGNNNLTSDQITDLGDTIQNTNLTEQQVTAITDDKYLRSDVSDTAEGQITFNVDPIISGASPTVRFSDTNGYDFWTHVNSNRFYILVDRDGVGNPPWDGEHPLELNAATDKGYVFGNEILTTATNVTYDLSARAGDADNQKKIRLSGSDGTNDDITIVASDGLSLTRSGNTLTLTNTVTAGNDVSNGGNNRVLTSTGGNGIRGETNLTYDGTNLHQQSNGAIISNGNIIAYYTSDVTLKDNVQQITNALEKVSSISGNTFTWNDKAPKSILEFVGEEDTGVIAQEVNELGLPGVVKTKDDGTMGVRYEKLVPLLIEAIKELKEEVNDLRSQIEG